MRTLAVPLEALMLSPYRQPRYTVYMWDILSTSAPALGSIIASTASTSYRIDVTPYVQGDVTIDEPGDSRAAQCTLTLGDLLGSFDPVSGQYATYMQRNQVVQVLIGDATVSSGDYVGAFFGHVRGQVGFTINRSTLRKETVISCYNRLATPPYLKRRFLSPSYGISVDFGTILQATARNEMGITSPELSRFPTTIGQATQFTTNSIADLAPIEAINKILEAVGHVADFDGDGLIRTYSRDMRRASDRTYALSQIISIEHPSSDTETYNSVKVIGLDKNITLLDQPEQALARATIPVGFWRPRHRVDVWWSEDRTLRAHSTVMVVETSVNDSLMFNIGSESYLEGSEHGGHIDVELSWILFAIAAIVGISLIVSYALPDTLDIPGLTTIPVGSLVQGALSQILFFTLSQSSSGVYEIRGIPVLPVYKEISAVLTIDGTPDYLLNQREIKNDWINSQEHLLAIATIELLFEAAQAAPRRIALIDDLALEVGDIIQYELSGQVYRVWVESLRRTLKRDEDVPVLEINGYAIPSGV